MTRSAVGPADSPAVRQAAMSFGSGPKGGRTVRVKGSPLPGPTDLQKSPYVKVYVAGKAMEVSLAWK